MSSASTAPVTGPADVPFAPEVLADLGACPTPYHAVARARALLTDVGFTEVDLGLPLPADPGPYLATNGGSLMAWVQQGEHRGFTIVGAHTDSPNLRVRTKPDVTSAGFEQIGMEIYGGVLLNSWLDRGLGLAGRVSLAATSGGIEERLFLDDRPLMIIPQLAIHLDRDVSSSGLKLDSQRHLIPLWALTGTGPEGPGEADDANGADSDADAVENGTEPEQPVSALRSHVADLLHVTVDQILAWDLMAFDVQPPSVIGRDQDMFSSARIDNLLSTFCGVRALASLVDGGAADLDTTPLLALYDHEEIGSASATGAAGSFLSSLMERIAAADGASRSEYLASLSRSLVVSADGAHATHPNYVERHEPSHRINLNGGVVVKRNANQRYATDAESEAFMVDLCRRIDVPLQFYIHRNDLPCGSTIGPITAARLGVATVDIGAPQLAMHSARETAGLADIGHLTAVLQEVWRRDIG